MQPAVNVQWHTAYSLARTNDGSSTGLAAHSLFEMCPLAEGVGKAQAAEDFVHPTAIITYYTVQGKAVPLQAWSGPKGSRKLRFPDFTGTGSW